MKQAFSTDSLCQKYRNVNRAEYIKKIQAVQQQTIDLPHEESLGNVDKLIQEYPNEPDPLLLKGNILAMMSTDNKISGKQIQDFDREREECIKQALKLKSNCVPAVIDMADLFQERATEENDYSFLKAREYYDRAYVLLKAGKAWVSLEEELEELELSKSIFMAKFKLNE